MTVRVGIIGAGVMGADHARILAGSVSGTAIAAVADADRERARSVAADCGAARAETDPAAVISAADVDAVLIASPDGTHKALVLECLYAGKPVLCEKPLATTAADALEIVGREAAIGRRLVQVGFMRRFDPGYAELRGTVENAALGAPLMMHCLHRNESAPPYVRTEGVILNSAVHEIDAARFVLGSEAVRIQVVLGRSTGHAAIRDPQFVLVQFADGTVMDAEIFVNARYGYDVRAELVCEEGTVCLTPPHDTTVLHAGHEGFRHPRDWRRRFAAAYRRQLQSWIASIEGGEPAGASAWDGYAATAIAEAGIRSQKSGGWVAVDLGEKPPLYASED